MRLSKQGGKREDPKIELSGTIFVVERGWCVILWFPVVEVGSVVGAEVLWELNILLFQLLGIFTREHSCGSV